MGILFSVCSGREQASTAASTSALLSVAASVQPTDHGFTFIFPISMTDSDVFGCLWSLSATHASSFREDCRLYKWRLLAKVSTLELCFLWVQTLPVSCTQIAADIAGDVAVSEVASYSWFVAVFIGALKSVLCSPLGADITTVFRRGEQAATSASASALFSVAGALKYTSWFPIVRVIAETTSVFEAALYSWFAADFATSAASTSVSEVVSIVSSTGSSLSSVGSSVNFDALKSALCSCMLLAIQQSVCVRSTGAQFSSLTVVSTLAAGWQLFWY